MSSVVIGLDLVFKAKSWLMLTLSFMFISEKKIAKRFL